MVSSISLIGLNSATPLYIKRLEENFISTIFLIFLVQFLIGITIYNLVFPSQTLFSDYRLIALQVMMPLNQILISMRLAADEKIKSFFIVMQTIVLISSIAIYFSGYEIFNVLLINIGGMVIINLLNNFGCKFKKQKIDLKSSINYIPFHISRIYGELISTTVSSPIRPLIINSLMLLGNSATYIFIFNIVQMLSSAFFQYCLRFFFKDFKNFETKSIASVIFDKDLKIENVVLYLFPIIVFFTLQQLNLIVFLSTVSIISLAIFFISMIISSRINVDLYRGFQTYNKNYLDGLKDSIRSAIMYTILLSTFNLGSYILVFYGVLNLVLSISFWFYIKRYSL